MWENFEENGGELLENVAENNEIYWNHENKKQGNLNKPDENHKIGDSPIMLNKIKKENKVSNTVG